MEVEEQLRYPRSIDIYWKARYGASSSSNLELPLDDDDVSQKEMFEALVVDCQLATFGRGGKDVYDEDYRHASAMNADRFCATFCPYEAGIIDVVTQLLLPPIVGDLEPVTCRSEHAIRHGLFNDEAVQIHDAIERELFMQDRSHGIGIDRAMSILQTLNVPVQHRQDHEAVVKALNLNMIRYDDMFTLAAQRLRDKRKRMEADQGLTPSDPDEIRKRMMRRGIRAELYKLNVYVGPSGHFKPHVDTPRSETQIGSLVVVLPVDFQGGALAVRHQGEEVVYDWSQSSDANDPSTYKPPSIKWAAFYSDCEHEVQQVKSGHRVTLTYNLYLSHGTGLLNGQPSSLAPSHLPLCRRLQSMLRSPDLMPRGGYLGINLAHSYPHTHS